MRELMLAMGALKERSKAGGSARAAQAKAQAAAVAWLGEMQVYTQHREESSQKNVRARLSRRRRPG